MSDRSRTHRAYDAERLLAPHLKRGMISLAT